MIILTGGAGFIGRVFLSRLNREGISDIIVVDSLGESTSWKNLRNKRFEDYLHRDALFQSPVLKDPIDAIVHLGANSSTTERNADFLMGTEARRWRAGGP